jgi:hypothetical protein
MRPYKDQHKLRLWIDSDPSLTNLCDEAYKVSPVAGLHCQCSWNKHSDPHLWIAKEKEQDPNPIEHPTKMDFMSIVVVYAHPLHNIYTYH